MQSFPLSSGAKINILEQITNYKHFTIMLLEDNEGTRLHHISEGFGPHPENMVREVIRRWLAGEGLPTKTWQTIIQCLKDVKLIRLAESLEAELTKNDVIT